MHHSYKFTTDYFNKNKIRTDQIYFSIFKASTYENNIFPTSREPLQNLHFRTNQKRDGIVRRWWGGTNIHQLSPICHRSSPCYFSILSRGNDRHPGTIRRDGGNGGLMLFYRTKIYKKIPTPTWYRVISFAYSC